MRIILSAVLIALFFTSVISAQDGFVNSCYRKDGTHIQLQYLSKPDEIKWSNYEPASYRQNQRYQNFPLIPSYSNDYNNNGIANHHDYDNIGAFGDYSNRPLSKHNCFDRDTTAPSYFYSYSYESYCHSFDYILNYDSRFYSDNYHKWDGKKFSSMK